MADELPTADRDLRLIAEAIRSQADISTRPGQFSELVTRAKQIREIADALPVLLDRARQQGRDEAAQAIGLERWQVATAVTAHAHSCPVCARSGRKGDWS